ncbi:MAG: Ornithine carbamoyltransferase, catabolic [Petrotoga mobilis]|nr:MAG: Ornithine carbamoyltransferase, catabolic [Petrotoga mobilis]
MEILAKYSGVPVWNGLTDEDHPTQVLADFLTVMENFEKPLNKIKFVYVGDGRNNMANALMIGASKMGMDFVIISPKELFPNNELVSEMEKTASENGGEITITDNLDAVANSDVIYTDVWISMGEESKVEERIKLLKPYQVNMDLIKKTNNPDVIFLHCLPSFHDTKTEMGYDVYQKYGIKEMEVTDEVFESKYSKVFDQAENRMHTIKAVMVATLVG